MRFIFDDYPNDTPIAKQTQKQKMSSSVEEEQLQLEKKRQREGCESEEEPKRWEVDDLGYADILPPQEVIESFFFLPSVIGFLLFVSFCL